MTQNADDTKLVAVVGCQRCGTTLTGMIIGSHPDLTYYDENGPYPVAVYKRRTYTRDTSHVGVKLTTLSPETKKFKQDNPTMKFLFLTRGILSACASMLKLKWVRPELLGEELQHSINYLYPSDYRDWVVQCFLEFDYHQNAHRLAALFAQVRFNLLYEYDYYDLDCMEVKYERLVANPEKMTHRVADFLDLKASGRMLEHHRFFNEVNIHGTQGNRTIDTRSIDKYKAHLDKARQFEILETALETHDRGVHYYGAFEDLNQNATESEVIEEKLNTLDLHEEDVSEGNIDPFKYAKATNALNEREKRMYQMYRDGVTRVKMAEHLNTDHDTMKMELAAMYYKNQRLEEFCNQSRCLYKTTKRVHLID